MNKQMLTNVITNLSNDEFYQDVRGVSDTIGFVLLVSMVVIGTTAIIGFGSVAISDTQQDAQIEHAKNVFANLDAQTSAVALGEGGGQRTVSLALASHQNTELYVESTGRITVTSNDGATTTTVLDQQMSRLVYENGESKVAYENGGVWYSEEGSDHTTMVTPPEFQYRDATLTMPLINVGNSDGSVGGNVFMLEKTSSTIQPSWQGRLDNQIITINITSPYYQAWGDYFEQRIDGVSVTYDHPNETASVELGNFEPDGFLASMDSAIYSSGNTHINNGGDVNSGDIKTAGTTTIDGGAKVTGTVYDGYSPNLNALDGWISTAITEAENNPAASGGDYTHMGEISGSESFTAGKYYADRVLIKNGGSKGPGKGKKKGGGGGGGSAETLTFDVSSGDIRLYVKEDFIFQGNADIEITGAESTGNEVLIFVGGSRYEFRQGGSTVTIDGQTPDDQTAKTKAHQVYGTSQMNVYMSNGVDWQGIIYAPRSTAQEGGGGNFKNSCTGWETCVDNGADVYGGIVGGSAKVEGGGDFTYDPELKHWGAPKAEFPISNARPKLFYLHISFNEVDYN